MSDSRISAGGNRTQSGPKLKVFLSYSRKDAQAFADELAGGLEFQGGFDVSLDRYSIVEGEDWKRRLGALIADADTVVFIVSPGAAGSEICQWEVNEATRLSKRILPVLWLAPHEGQRVPEQLTELNYTRFDEGRSFVNGLRALATALNTDIDWLREHTRLLARALEWENANRVENRMLTGPDIAAAKNWAARRPKEAPELTTHHLDFIRASEEAEKARNDALARQQEERARLLREAETANEERARALNQAEEALGLKARLERRQSIVAAIALVVLSFAGWWGYGAYREHLAAEAERKVVEKEASREDIRGQLVAFATTHGEIELDRAPGFETSPYTTPLASNLKIQNKSISEILVRTHQEVTDFAVKADPHGTVGLPQRPFFSTSMNGPVYLWKQPKSRRKHAVLISVADPGPELVGLGMERLTGPPYDVAAIAEVLLGAGFAREEISQLENPNAETIKAAIERAAQVLQNNSRHEPAVQPAIANKNNLLFVFYSGHGIAFDTTRYIIPNVVGADAALPTLLQTKAIRVEDLTKVAEAAAAASIVILDTHFPQISSQPKRR